MDGAYHSSFGDVSKLKCWVGRLAEWRYWLKGRGGGGFSPLKTPSQRRIAKQCGRRRRIALDSEDRNSLSDSTCLTTRVYGDDERIPGLCELCPSAKMRNLKDPFQSEIVYGRDPVRVVQCLSFLLSIAESRIIASMKTQNRGEERGQSRTLGYEEGWN